MAKALTGAALTKIKADPGKRLEIPDGILPGLYFVIQPTGRKSWAVRYRHNGQPRKVTLGNYLAGEDVSEAGEELKKLRHEAADILDSVRRGADPASEKQTAKKQGKVEIDIKRDQFPVVLDRYIREYASKRRNLSEKARLLGLQRKDDKWQALKENRPASIWADKRIQDITRRDVREHVEALAEKAPIGANRSFSELRAFFNWCVGKDILATSPMAGLQPPSEENASRNRVLIRRAEVPGSTDDELKWLWKAADIYDQGNAAEGKGGHGRKHRGPFGPFIQMLILTGASRREVSDMTWREVDLEQRTWTIPKERAKNGQPHSVPLSDVAMTLLEGMPRIRGSNLVFTTDGENPISGFSRMKTRIDKLMAVEAEGAEITAWTVHDIRRTVAAGMQRLGVRLEVTERVLNHLSGSLSGIAGVYQVHDFHDEKRAALEAWGRFVSDLIEGKSANVTYLRERA